jgi:2-aminoadipate transaminase
MLSQAITRNVDNVVGEGFCVNGEGKNRIRLNYSSTGPEKIGRGLELLTEVVRERMEPQSGQRNTEKSATWVSTGPPCSSR